MRVWAERQDACWQFTVREDGIAIEPQYVEKVFGSFPRLQGKDSHDGTGLDSAIRKRIADRYHGEIWVESETGK